MFRLDLDAAGVPYVVDGPDGRRYADCHSLRHTYIALVDKTGATLKEAMQLARHSDPKLTMAVYGRARLADLATAVGRLPTLLPRDGMSEDGPVQPEAGRVASTELAQEVDAARSDVRGGKGSRS